MIEIRDVLDGYRPAYHFYGHTEELCYQRRDTNGATLACKLSDLTWDDGRGGLVQAGSMAILTWHNLQEHSLEVVDEPWLKEYGKHTWQYV